MRSAAARGLPEVSATSLHQREHSTPASWSHLAVEEHAIWAINAEVLLMAVLLQQHLLQHPVQALHQVACQGCVETALLAL